MKTALRSKPIAVAFSVGNAFYNYDSGVFSDNGSGGICASGVNHGMTGVGFGVENGVEYVIVKNSWGLSWGENGYVKINISNNTCQILYWPSYPLTW